MSNGNKEQNIVLAFKDLIVLFRKQSMKSLITVSHGNSFLEVGVILGFLFMAQKNEFANTQGRKAGKKLFY